MLHSSCFFDRCSKTGNGGAIYFAGTSSIVQHRFCTTSTTISSGNGFHSYTNCNNNNNNEVYKNVLIDCSISQCDKQSSYHLISLYYGQCGIFNSNISKNSVKSFSGFSVSNAKGECMVNFTTFKDNYAAEWVCLYHIQSPEGSYKDYKCNIVNNSQGSKQYGIIHSHDEVTVENCTILGSYGNGKPFSKEYSTGCSFFIINCRVDSLELATSGGTFSTFNIIFTNVLNALPHLSTFKCEAKLKLSDLTYKKEKTVWHDYLFDSIMIVMPYTIIVL